MTRYSAIALVLLAASPAVAEEKTVERTFTVSPGGALVVDADSASVRVSGGNANQVTVRMRARGSKEDLAAAQFDAFQKDGGVTITMRQRGKDGWFNRGSWNSEGHIEVTVPQRYAINVKTGGGSVELTDTIGSATLRTSGGDIEVKGVSGDIKAHTSGGGIFADTIRGDVDAATSGGDIRLLQVDGKIRGQTSGGSVHCSLTGLNRGISAMTSGGSIELTLPRATTANLKATTSGGEFTSEVPVAIAEQQDGRVRGSINGGGPPIDVSTSGGGISLRAAN
ncbi:MAG TPA: DUF4097 family beta strand repeat-containing protein [Steroidobacteraceae bacterium]|nr:DUF4097 family beta strand repeat-containing protein [Steroidobacteraceae bacterium]